MNQQLFPDMWRVFWTSDRIPGVHHGDIMERATAEAWVEQMNRETKGTGLHHWCEAVDFVATAAPQEEPTP